MVDFVEGDRVRVHRTGFFGTVTKVVLIRGKTPCISVDLGDMGSGAYWPESLQFIHRPTGPKTSWQVLMEES